MVCTESLQRYAMKNLVNRWYAMNHYTVCNENHSGPMVCNESLQRYVMEKHSSSMAPDESLQRYVMKKHSGSIVCNESLQRYVMENIVVQWYVMNHYNDM
jgi:hypothetical protein